MTTFAVDSELAIFALESSDADTLAVFPSELGWMALATRDGRLARLVIGHDSPERAQQEVRTLLGIRAADWEGRELFQTEPDLASLVERLQDLAAGCRDDLLDIPVAIDNCPPFSRKVLAACRKIPYGQTQTYAELAAAAGSPRAARAVGRAMATNPAPLVIPCHRVIGARGHLRGYSAYGGLKLKRRLLDLEQTM